VASLLSGNCRTTDTVSRYGGEEFAIILPNTPKEAAAELAERFRWAIAESSVIRHQVTISIGLASLNASIANKSEFIEQADAALYQAKREGKNRVCLS